MRGDPLVEVEDLVGLGTTERSVPRQVLKTAPLALVGGHESIQVHAHTVFAAARLVRGPDILNR